jgi:TetR/AcrR family transcriptional regulator, transcriptional repressor for nem operon
VSDPRPSSHRDSLIDAMRRLALSKGFPGTTVDEICEMAGVTKGSFYHHFDSKDDLGTAALEAYFADVVAAFGGGPWVHVTDPVMRLRAFMANAIEVCTGPVMTYGCLIGSYALDLAESSPQLRGRLSEMFGALRDVVAGLITEAAQHQGRKVDAQAFGDQFLAVLEGSIVLAKAHADPSVPRRGLALLGEHLDLLLR